MKQRNIFESVVFLNEGLFSKFKKEKESDTKVSDDEYKKIKRDIGSCSRELYSIIKTSSKPEYKLYDNRKRENDEDNKEGTYHNITHIIAPLDKLDSIKNKVLSALKSKGFELVEDNRNYCEYTKAINSDKYKQVLVDVSVMDNFTKDKSGSLVVKTYTLATNY